MALELGRAACSVPDERRQAVDAALGPVRRVAVLRALSLGDMVCATPALAALRRRFPQAHITLVGQAWAQAWAARMPVIDDFVALPPHPLTDDVSEGGAAWDAFVQGMRARRLDLAVQLHGSGGVSNGVVGQWGARHVLAFHEPHAGRRGPPAVTGAPDVGVVWPQEGSEVARLLHLVDSLGPPSSRRQGTSPSAGHTALHHPVEEADRQAARALLRARGLPAGRGQGWVCVHPGSKWASRRWPVTRFAAVALELAQRGHTIVLTGSAHERDLVQAVQHSVPQAIDLCGLTDLWTLGAVIDGARLLLCNDTGVSHLAAARRVPSVVVSCGSDVARWSPADALRHRVLWSAPACRPCVQAACSQPRHTCAEDIGVAQVLAAAQAALRCPR